MKALEQLIVALIKRFIHKQSFTAKVVSVDKEKDTCKVKPDDGPELFGVRLTAVEDTLNNKVVAYPKVGSYVMVSLIENLPGEAYVSKNGEIEQLKIIANNMIINDGAMGGLANAKKIREEYNKTKQIVDAIMTVCDTTVNEPGNGSPSAFQAALKLALTGKQTGDFSDIENKNVTHG